MESDVNRLEQLIPNEVFLGQLQQGDKRATNWSAVWRHDAAGESAGVFFRGRTSTRACGLTLCRRRCAECEDGNGRSVFEKAIEFTDFPDDGIELWFENSTIYLPSEH